MRVPKWAGGDRHDCPREHTAITYLHTHIESVLNDCFRALPRLYLGAAMEVKMCILAAGD